MHCLSIDGFTVLKNPAALTRVQEEVDNVLQDRLPRYEDVKELKYLMRCINESMRLYPHPPVCFIYFLDVQGHIIGIILLFCFRC